MCRAVQQWLGRSPRLRLRRLTVVLLVPAVLGLWWADGYSRGEVVLALALLGRYRWRER